VAKDPFVEFTQLENALWDDAFGDAFSDPVAEALFHEAYFVRDSAFSPEELGAIRDSLKDYMRDEYGIDFDAEFDWDAWRESYSDA
jgi:hypothetical protein